MVRVSKDLSCRYPSLEANEDEKDIQDLDDSKLFVLCVFDNEDKKKISFVWHSEKFRAHGVSQRG